MFRRNRDHQPEPDGQAIPPELRDRLPVDPGTDRPLPPTAQPGYYPGYHVLSQEGYWDEATRDVVLNRVHNIPPIRFFTADEAALLEAICARALPQDDRDADHRIPIVPAIDARLYNGIIDGYRYEDMPPDREAYKLGLQGIEAIARHQHGKGFRDLGPREQDEVLRSIHRGAPTAGDDIWRRLPPDRFWLLLLGDVVGAYYAHPYAWDEIGFGGPAYPRGYMRLEGGRPEPWEVDERRYEWKAPPTSLSDEHHPLGGAHPGHAQSSGQAGTH
ncbi:MAG TPA: gluconate 2-dehydrogenase subunit 3 family protein [Thermomicrobiales bacterium]|nr:gluconate 2-dehydrogenase subunit 3 family protein [Thermomicrobiales bacterium]